MVFGRLGWRVIEWMGALIGALAGSVLRIRRRHVVESLRSAGVAEPERVASAMYRSLGVGLCELLGSGLFSSRELGDRVRVDGRALLGSGLGAVVATAHTGNWDLVACEAARTVPLTVVTKRLSIGWLDRLWQGIRLRRGVRLARAGSAFATARDALRLGGAVAMLIDQAPERTRGAIRMRFFGRMAWVDLAPALLAMRLRRPLIAAFPLRGADGTYTLHVAGRLEPPRSASRAWAGEAMTVVTGWLEDFVRRHPEQWLWMHRRWKGVEGDGRGSRGDHAAL